MPANDQASEKRERTADFRTDLCRDCVITQCSQFAELLRIRKRTIDALAACFDQNFLMNGFRAMRKTIVVQVRSFGCQARALSEQTKRCHHGKKAHGKLSPCKQIRKHCCSPLGMGGMNLQY